MWGGGQFDRLRADISDGVNEKGLCAQKLTFANGAQLKSQRRTDKTQLAGFEFVLWALGHCVSVADVIAQLPDIELMDDTHSDVKYGYPELHFALTDPTGRIVVIEPTTMPMRVIENPLGVVTNSPNFDKQLAQLDQYMDFTPAFRAGQAPLKSQRAACRANRFHRDRIRRGPALFGQPTLRNGLINPVMNKKHLSAVGDCWMA